MTEEKHRNWDIGIKLIGSLITLLTIIIGIFQYNKNNEREYRKKVYDEQFKVYNEFIEASVKLSQWKKNQIYDSSVDGVKLLKEDFKTDYAGFEKIYYGKLRLMQSEEVDSLATDFFVMINQYKSQGSKVSNTELINLINDIIVASKASLQDTWDIDLQELK